LVVTFLLLCCLLLPLPPWHGISAADDVEDCETVRQLLEDIETRRQQKIRTGVGMVLEQAKRGEITNAIAVRVNVTTTSL
jgi:hypothetical protein